MTRAAFVVPLCVPLALVPPARRLSRYGIVAAAGNGMVYLRY